MHLEINDITVAYDKVEVLHGVSLVVEPNTIVALIGANGAGKTTLLKTVSGLNTPSNGDIRFDGTRIDGLSPSKIVKMGLIHILEGRGLFPQMSVYENLLMGAYLSNDARRNNDNLKSVYEFFPVLKDRTEQKAGSLSGGEQQMLAIARAMMANPKMLLVDEPSIGLSPLLVETMAEVIGAINKNSGVSILLVEQNVSLALSLAQKGYVLETGSIVSEGPSEDLLNSEEVKKAYLGR